MKEKKLYTEQDIRDLGLRRKVRRIELEPGDIITPLALDAARSLTIEIVHVRAGEGHGSPSAPDGIGAAMPGYAVPHQPDRRSPAELSRGALTPGARIKRVETRDFQIPPFAFDVGRPEMDIRCGDIITSADGAPMAAGFLSIREGSFPWTLDYHEIQYVLEGELHIGTKEGPLVGKPGDVFYVPQGSSITFGTPSWAKFFYVTYPADWAEE